MSKGSPGGRYARVRTTEIRRKNDPPFNKAAVRKEFTKLFNEVVRERMSELVREIVRERDRGDRERTRREVAEEELARLRSAQSDPTHPVPEPPAATDSLREFLDTLDDLPVSRDPLDEWIKAHRAELRPYAGQQAAIDPARDLLVVSPTLEELLAELKRRGLDQDTELTLTPIF